MQTATRPPGQPEPWQRVVSWLSRVFQLNPGGLNWPRAVLFLDIALVPLVVFWAIGYEQYLLSALFGLLFCWLIDPGGSYGSRVSRIAGFGLIGAGVTALGFGIGGDAWGWLVLAVSLVTFVAGLAVTFGVHRFVAGMVLNIWFVVALAVEFSLHTHARVTSYTWAQVLAWAGGSALWIAVTFVAWLLGGREDRPQPIAELPGDTAVRRLTRPVIMFAVIRALAMGGAAALAFGLNLSYGYWIAIATMIAMKPDLGQSTLIAAQRLAGAMIGAAVAALLLLIPANLSGLHLFTVEHGFEIVALVFLMHGVATRFWNYACYTAAIAAGVLILVDLPQPSSFDAVGWRVLWTLTGVGIGLIVILLGGLLGRATARPQPQPQPPAPQPARQPAGTSQIR